MYFENLPRNDIAILYSLNYNQNVIFELSLHSLINYNNYLI